jgi:hypothetical protein
MTVRRKQATRHNPWRLEIRATSRSVLVVVVLLVISGLYLAVNARLASAGRSVMVLENRRAELQRQNAERTALYAELTNPNAMFERAEDLGYKPAEPDDIFFLEIEGYAPPPPFVAPRPAVSKLERVSRLSPAYTETLGEWMTRWLSLD